MPFLPDATPCPGNLGASLPSEQKLGHSRFSIFGDDTVATEDLDFTTEVRTQFRAVPPRRGRLGVLRRPTTFDIHEDGEGHGSSPAKKASEECRQPRGFGATLSHPAHRLRPSHRAPSERRLSAEQAVAAARDWFGAPHKTTVDIRPTADFSDPPAPKNARRRRGTVYIPSEDTTVPSVFLGIFSPIKTQAQLNAEHEALGRIEVEIARKRAPKKSLAAAPKRAPLPLQPTLRVVQESAVREEVYIGRQGKENIPPNVKVNEDWNTLDIKPPKHKDAETQPSIKHRRSSTLDSDVGQFLIHDISGGRSRLKPAGEVPGCKPAIIRPVIRPHKALELPEYSNRPAPKKPKTVSKQSGPQLARDSSSSMATSRIHERPRPPLPTIRPHYPLITEGVQYSHLYEDNWLDHQENAYTQLINYFFISTQAASITENSSFVQDSLQQSLLQKYHTPLFSELHQRLRASIEHGALKMPKSSLENVRLGKDVGQKRKFLDLWLDTYDITVLTTAAEVIIGRKSFQPSGSDESHVSRKGTAPRKVDLEDFLCTYFIRNEDKTLDENDQKSATNDLDGRGWHHAHTTLRSLMLVLLLDRFKETSSTFSGCLFSPASTYKSSVEVLGALRVILLPSVGDILRSLSHLGFELRHVQIPLDEYEYKINNLATDFRDGVRLARLVELLKLNVATENGSFSKNPSFEVGVKRHAEEWALSRKLKFPATSKATQLFNVQMSLEAVSQNKAVKAIVQDVRAEDIVNGHREKTLALLWALVGKYGLPSLVDMEDVTRETRRLNRKWNRPADLSSKLIGVEDCSERCGIVLKEWAGSLAHLRGIIIGNFTSDFAGQKGYRVFEAIMDEYEAYLPAESKAVLKGNKAGGGLRDRLQALGCSSQFAKIFQPKRDGAGGDYNFLFNRETTIAALAFFASRLLPATKHARAAIVIQRAWRLMVRRWRAQIDG